MTRVEELLLSEAGASPEVAAHHLGIELVFGELGGGEVLADASLVIVQQGAAQAGLAWYGIAAALCRRYEVPATDLQCFALAALAWEKSRRAGSGTYSRVAG